VRIAGTGLCHTDLVAQAGAFPLSLPAVLGHEGAGIVEQVGSEVRRFKPGDRVAMSSLSYGHCASCADHAQRNAAVIECHGGRFLVRGGIFRNPEAAAAAATS